MPRLATPGIEDSPFRQGLCSSNSVGKSRGSIGLKEVSQVLTVQGGEPLATWGHKRYPHGGNSAQPTDLGLIFLPGSAGCQGRVGEPSIL